MASDMNTYTDTDLVLHTIVYGARRGGGEGGGGAGDAGQRIFGVFLTLFPCMEEEKSVYPTALQSVVLTGPIMLVLMNVISLTHRSGSSPLVCGVI